MDEGYQPGTYGDRLRVTGQVRARVRAVLTAVASAGCAVALLGAWRGRPAPVRPSACNTDAFARPALYSIPLLPDQGLSGSGTATLIPAPSPFGLTLTADGHPIFDVTVSVQNLPNPASVGGTEYVAWATTQDLTDANNLGVIGKDLKTQGKVAWNKYIVLVTAEKPPIGDHWKGTVILRGFSPSTYLTNYASHPLFLGGMPPC
jgi:hypothetical protein